MKTIILPGFSIKNKDWAHAVKYNLGSEDIIVHEWFHWITERDEDFNVQQETLRLSLKEPHNIIAKSMGTVVAVNLLKSNLENINKVIFCGIPLGDIQSKELSDYEVLKDLDISKFLFIQNENDTHGSHKNVSEFLSKINPAIKIISKPGDNHEYPYWEEFKEFLA